MKQITSLLFFLVAFQFVNAQKTTVKTYPYFYSFSKVKLTGEEKTYVYITPVEKCNTDEKDRAAITNAFSQLIALKNEGKSVEIKTGDNNFYETLEEANIQYQKALRYFSNNTKYTVIKLSYDELKAFLEK